MLLLGYVEKRIWGIQPTQIHKKTVERNIFIADCIYFTFCISLWHLYQLYELSISVTSLLSAVYIFLILTIKNNEIHSTYNLLL